jgi:D-arabinose 1-dehydrogenase-like Zn-dependent alcohol dehydrogenase
MGFLRKVAIYGTGGLARVAIKPNSKKERTVKAMEQQLKLQKKAAKEEAQDRRRHR